MCRRCQAGVGSTPAGGETAGVSRARGAAASLTWTVHVTHRLALSPRAQAPGSGAGPEPVGPPGHPGDSVAAEAVHAAERRALDLADKVSVLEKQLAAEQRERREQLDKVAEEARVTARAAADEVRDLWEARGAATHTCVCIAPAVRCDAV